MDIPVLNHMTREQLSAIMIIIYLAVGSEKVIAHDIEYNLTHNYLCDGTCRRYCHGQFRVVSP